MCDVSGNISGSQAVRNEYGTVGYLKRREMLHRDTMTEGKRITEGTRVREKQSDSYLLMLVTEMIWNEQEGKILFVSDSCHRKRKNT